MSRHKIEYEGQTWTLIDLSRKIGIHRTTLDRWLASGMTIAEAMEKKVRRVDKVRIGPRVYTVKEVCRLAGITRGTYYKRKKFDWNSAEMITPPAARQPVTAYGKRQSLSAWSRELNIPRSTLRGRLRDGMSPEVAFSRRSWRGYMLTAWGRTQSIAEWSKETGLSRRLIYWRVAEQGLSHEMALSAPLPERKKKDET